MLSHFAAFARRLPGGRFKVRIGRVVAALIAQLGGDPVVQVRFRDGTIMMLDARGRTEGGPVWTGEYDPHTIAVLQACLPLGGNLLDIGGNVGLIALPAARWLASSNGRVTTVEPVEANAARIRASAALNDLDIELFECAVGDTNGTVEMDRETSFGASTGNAIIRQGCSSGAVTSVPLRRLDDLKITAVDVIKIDVEGAEVPALRGGKDLIEKCRPLILGEFHSGLMPRFGYTFLDVGDLVSEWNYVVVVWEGWNRPVVATPRVGLGNAILVPSERLQHVLRQLEAVPPR